MNDRPLCSCHGETMYWQKDKRRTNDGYWYCAVKQLEKCRARYANDPLHRIRKIDQSRRAQALERARERQQRPRNPKLAAFLVTVRQEG